MTSSRRPSWIGHAGARLQAAVRPDPCLYKQLPRARTARPTIGSRPRSSISRLRPRTSRRAGGQVVPDRQRARTQAAQARGRRARREESRISRCSIARSSLPAPAWQQTEIKAPITAGARGAGPRRRGQQRAGARHGRPLRDGRGRRGLSGRRAAAEAGDAASVQVLDQAVAGKVTAIGSVVGKNQLTNLDPRALQDRRVVKVTIALDQPEPGRDGSSTWKWMSRSRRAAARSRRPLRVSGQ